MVDARPSLGSSEAPSVLGVDASPRATGLALPDGTTQVLRNSLKGDARLEWIHQHPVWAALPPLDLIVLEGYAHASAGVGAATIREVGGVIRLTLWEACRCPVLLVAPMKRAGYATGRGNAKKAEVLAAWRGVTGLNFQDDNACDAHVLREMGLALLGQPSYRLDSNRARFLLGVRLPIQSKPAGRSPRKAAVTPTEEID